LPSLTADEIARRKHGPCEFEREDDYGFQLLFLDRYSWELVRFAMEDGPVSSGAGLGVRQEYLNAFWFALVEDDSGQKERWTLRVAEEARAKWPEMREVILKDRATCDHAEDYAIAAAHLYGAIGSDLLFKMVKDSEPDFDMDAQEFADYVHWRSLSPAYGYVMLPNRIIGSAAFDDDSEGAFDLIDRRSAYPRYQPSGEELLKYADPSYERPSLALLDFRAWVSQKVQGDEGLTYDAVAGVLSDIRENMPVAEVLLGLRRVPVEWESSEQEKVEGLIEGLIRITRLWDLNGNTMEEMEERGLLEEGDVDCYGYTDCGMPFVASPKVGRNDPCPCGSGKKYKNCCGR